MTSASENKSISCGSQSVPPSLVYMRSDNGIELHDHAFLRPIPVCCANIASPYWARIIGTVVNVRPDEVFVTIRAFFFDNNGNNVGAHHDFMVLDPGRKGEFDIKVPVFYENVAAYGLEAVEADQQREE